eukprot:Polyplicarium_translucidae@DN5123_c0_g1_i1.p1
MVQTSGSLLDNGAVDALFKQYAINSLLPNGLLGVSENAKLAGLYDAKFATEPPGACGLPGYVHPEVANGLFTCEQVCLITGSKCDPRSQLLLDADLGTCTCFFEQAGVTFEQEGCLVGDSAPAGCVYDGASVSVNIHDNYPGCTNPGVENLDFTRLCACKSHHGP